jgi:heme-degrading monooxygenase HmoA
MQHVRVATYAITSGTAEEVIRAARDGMLPVFQQQPGFMGYGVAEDGNGTILSISRWDTHEAAERATGTAAEWVRDNLADRLSLLSSYVGDFGLYAEA